MRPADKINGSIKKLHVKASADLDKRVHDDISKALAESKQTKSAPPEPNIWRIIMKSRIAKLAAAAVVMITCVIGLSVWRTTGSGIALADVLARIEQVKAFRYQWFGTGEDPDNPYSFLRRATTLSSQEYGSKTTMEELDPNGGWSTFQEGYRSPDNKTAIIIWPKQKKYRRVEFDDGTAERMWEVINDPRTLVKKILACKYESLGRSTIDGIEVEGFRTTDPNFFYLYIGDRQIDVNQIDFKMWVDAKTRLPVRYDYMGDKRKGTHFVMQDFQWDVPVDAAEFKPVIPDDYTGMAVKSPAHITEETAIQGLKVLGELLGKYPERINLTYLYSAFEKSETPAALRLKEELKGLTGLGENQKRMNALKPMLLLNMFYVGVDGKDPAYYGETVTPKDADKVLLRWKVSDNEYRVIFGDLHAETVSPEKLAELEAALPK
jgi:hypothetical protein